MCHGCSYGGYNCGMLAHVKEGQFERVSGNPHHPLNRGKLCAKGQAAVQWVYNPQRLKVPLVRDGAKGSGSFKRVTWEEALGITAERILDIKEHHGPEYLMLGKGQSSGWLNLHHFLWIRFLYALGSPNLTNWGPSVCYAPQLMYHRQIIGGPTYARPDYDHADLIIEWFTGGGQGGAARRGVETLDTNLRTIPLAIINRLKRGARLIFINPQLIPLAANGRAHQWFPIRPGTDAALALAMIHVTINEDLYDKAFVAEWCEGFDRLHEHVQQYSPEWAARITGIPAEGIRDLARRYATTRRACIRYSEAPQKKDLRSFATAIPILMAITGHLDRVGGNVWFSPAGRLGFDTFSGNLSDRVKERVLGADRFYVRSKGKRSAAFPDAVHALITGRPYRPKGMLVFGSNPMSTARNPRLIADALKQLEFLLVVDVVPTPTSRFADVILPAATRYECEGQPALWDNHLATTSKVIDPLWESRNELEITLDLACRLGMGERFWNGDYRTMVHDFLKPVGVTMDQLQEKALEGIPLPEVKWSKDRERYADLFQDLPNHKIQLYNALLDRHGFEPLPTFKGEPEDPLNSEKLLEEYPLIFTDEHSGYVNHHAWMRDIPWLRELVRNSYVRINPLTAKQYGIENGDWLDVISPHGRMKAVALLCPGIRPDTIMGQHGWWQACSPLGLPEFAPLDGGTNPNVLYNWEFRDDLSGDITKNTLVRIEKGLAPEEIPPLKEVE
ncbi:MAG: molybdopterin-dependent oxidoreductase [Deltaproteobacteria bacterium]|nr:molybdopterin-dependent oxidoreductase [Deltaproteobacteria bacterium]